MTNPIHTLATPLLAAAATAAWAITVRNSAIEVVVHAFAVVGLGCAVAAIYFCPVQPSITGTLTVSFMLASYQLLLFIAFTYGDAARAQAIVNTNFLLILMYDTWSGAQAFSLVAGCASAGIVLCTVVLVGSNYDRT